MTRGRSSSDEQHLADFFTGERLRLVRYLTRQAGNRADAEDLLQEVWIRFARNADRAIEAPRAYLSRVMQSVVIDFARNNHRRLKGAHVDLSPKLAAEAPTPEDTAVAQSELVCLEEALGELPKRCRDIFIRANLHGQSCRDIAAAYGLSRRTIEMEVKAALEHCAQRLGRNPR